MIRVRIYTDDEIKKLLENPNVIKIKNKSKIEYKNTFKYWAVMQKIKNPEKTSREIFEKAGFDMNILSSRTPQKRISCWIEQYKKFGIEYFLCKNKYRFSATKTVKEIDDKTNYEKIIDSLKELSVTIERLLNELK